MPRSAVRFSLLFAGLCAMASSPSRAASVELVTRLPPDQVVGANLAQGAELGALRHAGSSVSANGDFIVTRKHLSGPFGRYSPVIRGLLYDRTGTGLGAGSSSSTAFFPHISADGRYVAYDYFFNSITPFPFFGSSILDRTTGSLAQVAGGGGIPGYVMSVGGRFGVYTGNGGILTQSDRLVGVFFGGRTISPGSGDVQTPDGRIVAFSSLESGLDAGAVDSNGASDVFVWDQASGGLTLLSRRAGSTEAGNRASSNPLIAADGRIVLFRSEAGDLVTGQVDTATRQLFLLDRAAGVTRLVSHVSALPQNPVGAPVDDAVLSANGRLAAWVSSASDAVAGQLGPAVSQVFLSDLTTGETLLVSRSAASPTVGANGASTYPNLSGDGRYVSYESTATDLVPGQIDTAGTPDIFLFDRVTGTTVLASRSAGTEATAANGASTRPEISLDGDTVVWNSLASDLAPGDLNGALDVYAFRQDLETSPGRFFTLPPCRLLDTREPLQGPAMASGDVVVRWPNGRCPIPWTARALSVNVTAVPSNDGYVVLFPGDLTTPPGNSTLNFRGGRVQANNAVVGLSRDGEATFTTHAAVVGGGTVHLVIDVNGYFE